MFNILNIPLSQYRLNCFICNLIHSKYCYFTAAKNNISITKHIFHLVNNVELDVASGRED